MPRAFITWSRASDGKPVVPVRCLRIFAEADQRRHFVEVYIWQHQYQMRATWNQPKPKGHRILAHFISFIESKEEPDTLGRTVTSRKIGEIHLCLKGLTYDTIAHEAYHATREYARRAGNREPDTVKTNAAIKPHYDLPEERNARFQGQLTDRIITAALELVPSVAR